MATENEIEQGVGGAFFRDAPTHEEIADEWRAALTELGLSPVELADYMKKQGGITDLIRPSCAAYSA